jgi:hypothetical protein
MAKHKRWREIPTELSLERFREFVLPHLSVGSRGPAPKLSLHTLFNYILKLLYLGCQWKELPIAKDDQGREEIHLSLSRLDHRLPWPQAHPEIMQCAADFHHQISDALLPQPNPIFDDATALDTTIDMLNPKTAVMQ